MSIGTMAEESQDQRLQVIASDLQTSWQDHFHMRDQTWKVLQYSILFFLGVVGLEIDGSGKALLVLANAALLVTSVFGFVVAVHHRRRQNEKFKIIEIYEEQLGLHELKKPVLDDARKTFAGRINTSTYIVVMQLALALIAILLLGKHFLPSVLN